MNAALAVLPQDVQLWVFPEGILGRKAALWGSHLGLSPWIGAAQAGLFPTEHFPMFPFAQRNFHDLIDKKAFPRIELKSPF